MSSIYPNPYGNQPGMNAPPGNPYTLPGNPYTPPGNQYAPSGPNQPPLPPGAPVQWMQRPNPIPGCPPGLEYLTQIDSLIVQEQANFLEMFTGWQASNRYQITNKAHQQCYFGFETTDACHRTYCGPNRGFVINIVDNHNQEVMRISREFKCCGGHGWCAGCCDCAAHEVQVEAPVGTVIGYVREKGSFWKPKYDVLDENRNPILQIVGPCCIIQGLCCPCDNDFQVTTKDGGQEIGKISKQWGGFVQQVFTNAETFSVQFPQDLNVKQKATLLGGLFLIDFMFYEVNRGRRNRR